MKLPKKPTKDKKTNNNIYLIAAAIFCVLVLLFWWTKSSNSIQFVPMEGKVSSTLAECSGCEFRYESSPVPNEPAAEDQFVRLYSNNNNKIADLAVYEYTIQDQKKYTSLAQLILKNGEYIITKRVNSGSGGGAYYQVYKLQGQTVKKLNSSTVFSCENPKLIKNERKLSFENFGSHCDWLDTGSGKGEKVEINLE